MKSSAVIGAPKRRRKISGKRSFTTENYSTKFLEDIMRNLNEPLRKEPKDVQPNEAQVNAAQRAEADVVPSNVRQRQAGETRPSPTVTRDMDDLRERWSTAQRRLIDETRNAGTDAHQLASTATQRLSEPFRNPRRKREKQRPS